MSVNVQTNREPRPALSGDDIWALHNDLQKLIDRAQGDTKRVLQLAKETLATAGSMEDRKAIQERDGSLTDVASISSNNAIAEDQVASSEEL